MDLHADRHGKQSHHEASCGRSARLVNPEGIHQKKPHGKPGERKKSAAPERLFRRIADDGKADARDRSKGRADQVLGQEIAHRGPLDLHLSDSGDRKRQHQPERDAEHEEHRIDKPSDAVERMVVNEIHHAVDEHDPRDKVEHRGCKRHILRSAVQEKKVGRGDERARKGADQKDAKRIQAQVQQALSQKHAGQRGGEHEEHRAEVAAENPAQARVGKRRNKKHQPGRRLRAGNDLLVAAPHLLKREMLVKRLPGEFAQVAVQAKVHARPWNMLHIRVGLHLLVVQRERERP